MRILTAAIVIAPLMLVGALPAIADQPMPRTPTQLAAGGDPSADRDSYTQKARNEVQDWQKKLHDFSETATANGQREGAAAENDLNAAWAKTEAEAQKLQTASAEDWESAKLSFEKASHELADAWDRVTPQGK